MGPEIVGFPVGAVTFGTITKKAKALFVCVRGTGVGPLLGEGSEFLSCGWEHGPGRMGDRVLESGTVSCIYWISVLLL